MTNGELKARIGDRLASIQIRPDSVQLEQLAAYCQLLARWNGKINLTALQLEEFPVATLDALVVEPLSILGLIDRGSFRWFDFGSGGGSPAVPIQVMRPDLSLMMVESKARKSAFLREVVRNLGITAEVRTGRIEELDNARVAKLITMRAVRLTDEIWSAAERILLPAGHLALFGTDEVPALPLRFELRSSVSLPTPGHRLHVLERTEAP